jgi:hypothetical protein
MPAPSVAPDPGFAYDAQGYPPLGGEANGQISAEHPPVFPGEIRTHRPSRGQKIGIVGLALAVLLGVAGVGWWLFGPDPQPTPVVATATPSEKPAPKTTTTAPTTTTQAPGAWCIESNEPNHWVGARPGDTNGPVGAIFMYESGYFVARSIDEALKAVTGNSPLVARKEAVQQGIDSIAPGTTHCVDITGLSPTTFRVVVSAKSPVMTTPERFSPQLVTTVEVPGKGWFVSNFERTQ